MNLNELEVDYVYEATHKTDATQNEILVVTNMGKAMEGETLSNKKHNDLPLTWYLFVSEKCGYDFTLLGHKSEFPEYFL